MARDYLGFISLTSSQQLRLGLLPTIYYNMIIGSVTIALFYI